MRSNLRRCLSSLSGEAGARFGGDSHAACSELSSAIVTIRGDGARWSGSLEAEEEEEGGESGGACGPPSVLAWREEREEGGDVGLRFSGLFGLLPLPAS